MSLVKKGEYARLKGWRSPSYVTKLIAAGVVVLSKDGRLVDVEASDRNLQARQSIDRQGLREYHEQQRQAQAPVGASAQPVTPPASPEPRQTVDKGDFALFNSARAKKEQELARIAELDRMEREGKLVDADSVRMAAANVGRIVERALMGISPQLAEKLAGEVDPALCARMIDAEMRRIRAELADELEKLAVEAEDRNA